MYRREPDYLKYGQLDPEDDEVFFGPITLRELKKSIEVEERIVQRRLLENRIEQMKLEDKENQDNDDLNRTFDIENDQNEKQFQNSSIQQETLRDITQLHQNLEETKLVEVSVQFSKPSKVVPTVKKDACILDDTLNFNESMKACLPTPLIDKVFKSKASPAMKEYVSSPKKNGAKSIVGTPRLVKLSDTFISDIESNVLVNTTISDDAGTESEAVKRVRTPNIFKQNRNEMWKDSSDLRKSAFKSKLPKKKTPVKDNSYLFPRSPVADYIHRGIEVRSMSKSRHSHCVPELNEARSKSDNKNTQYCKIPVSVSGNVKRKLNLVGFGLRPPLFTNPKE